MRQFWGEARDKSHIVGCTGQTVYVYDAEANELAKFKDITYGYLPVISPDGRLCVVKSTAGLLAVYDLNALQLVKKFRFSSIDGAQDENLCFSPNGRWLLNIEKWSWGGTRLSIYDTETFRCVKRLFEEEPFVLQHIEFTEEGCFVLGYLRTDLAKKSFVAKVEGENLSQAVNLPEDTFLKCGDYYSIAAHGFTQKIMEWSLLKLMGYDIEQIRANGCSLYELWVRNNTEPLEVCDANA